MEITWHKDKDAEIKELYFEKTGENLRGVEGQEGWMWTNSDRITNEQYNQLATDIAANNLNSYFNVYLWLPKPFEII